MTEPVASKKPKFSSDAKKSWYDRVVGQDLTLFCPAQGFPVPSHRYIYIQKELIVERVYIHISKQGLLSYRQSRSPRGSQSSRATRSSAGTSVLSANISRSSVPPRGSPSPRIGIYIHTYKQREKEFKLNRLDVFVFARFDQNRWAAKRRRSPAL